MMHTTDPARALQPVLPKWLASKFNSRTSCERGMTGGASGGVRGTSSAMPDDDAMGQLECTTSKHLGKNRFATHGGHEFAKFANAGVADVVAAARESLQGGGDGIFRLVSRCTFASFGQRRRRGSPVTRVCT